MKHQGFLAKQVIMSEVFAKPLRTSRPGWALFSRTGLLSFSTAAHFDSNGSFCNPHRWIEGGLHRCQYSLNWNVFRLTKSEVTIINYRKTCSRRSLAIYDNRHPIPIRFASLILPYYRLSLPLTKNTVITFTILGKPCTRPQKIMSTPTVDPQDVFRTWGVMFPECGEAISNRLCEPVQRETVGFAIRHVVIFPMSRSSTWFKATGTYTNQPQWILCSLLHFSHKCYITACSYWYGWWTSSKLGSKQMEATLIRFLPNPIII